MEHDHKADIEKELDEIDRTIIARSKAVEDLKCRRYELIAELDNLDIHEAVECAIENDISPRRLIKMIISDAKICQSTGAH